MTSSLDGVFLRKVWRRLRDSAVPIVDEEDYKKSDAIAKELSEAIDCHLFLPSITHGYLGIQKGGGVTRFLPILSARDMGVYYYLCYRLAPKILESRSGIYGAWHMKPENSGSQQQEDEARAFGQDYGSNPFSSHWWLKNWTQFNDLIKALTEDRSVGPYVVSTDVANFYDSIEIPRLIGKIRAHAPGENDTIEALSAFLSSWNRRHIGYMPSTKGIPQEIISDASRILSHFYLQEFDKQFLAYCSGEGLTYVRWSDDILIFGSSKQKLQSAVHSASKLLRDIGLNLNASKTKYMSKSELRRYRALDFLRAISMKDHSAVSRELKKIKSMESKGESFRLDTAFKAFIGYVASNSAARTSLSRAFILEIGDRHVDLLHSLNNTQMLRFLQVHDKPLDAFAELKKNICKADFGNPRASFLHMMRKYRSQLATIGMTKKKLYLPSITLRAGAKIATLS